MPDSHPLGATLTRKILIGLAAGIAVGALINLVGQPEWAQTYLVDAVFDTVGQVFVLALKMLIVPLVLVSLVCGVSALSDPSRLGRLGGKALGLYLATTAVAVTTGLLAAALIDPGVGVNMTAANFTATPSPSLKEVLLDMVPENPVAAMAEGKMLQLIVFAILFGLALNFAGKPGERIKAIFTDLNRVVMELVTIVMRLAPYGVFALVARLAATLEAAAIGEVAAYFFTVLGVLLFHGLVTYPVLLKLLSGLNPVIFLSKMRAVMTFAFSTASSGATLPVTLRTVEERLGVHNSVASFTVPLGATINMDGTAIMQGVATVFIANAFGIDLSVTQLAMVVLMAVLASVGTAAVPGVGLVMLTTVLTQVGLPVEGIGLILGVDRLLDMVRTAVNVTGDATVTSIVAVSEGEFDREVFDDLEAGQITGDLEAEAKGA